MAEINKRSTKQESQAVAAFGVTAGIQEGVIISARNPHYPQPSFWTPQRKYGAPSLTLPFYFYRELFIVVPSNASHAQNGRPIFSNTSHVIQLSSITSAP